MFRTLLLATTDPIPEPAFDQVVERVASLYRARFVRAVAQCGEHAGSARSGGASRSSADVPTDQSTSARTVVLSGDFIAAVCDRGHEADVIVVWHGCLMGPDGQPSDEEMSKLVRQAPRPVWLGRPPVRFPERVLVAYDGSAHSGRALHMAASLAETLGAHLTALHVEESRDEQAQELILARAAGYCEPYRITLERVGVYGSAAPAIRDYALSSQCDLLVVGAAGVGYLRGLLFGSVAGQLIATAPCSVLVAK
jgi:nucleotide-binding universal stress UspA family protein